MATTEDTIRDFLATLPAEYREAFLADALSRVKTVEQDTPARPPIVPWIEENFYLPDTRKLIRLFDFQRRALERAVSTEADGKYRYTTVLWSWIKKSAKTSIVSAVCDYIADNTPNGRIALVANDLNQADSRVGDYIRLSIQTAQKQGKRRGIKISASNYRIDYPNGARIEMLPIDPTGEAGGNHDLIVFSELHGWKSKAHLKMWAEMTISPNKFGRAQRWIDTYAGYDGESPVLENLYDYVVTSGRRIWEDFEAYENGQTFACWVTQPMFPWQTKEYYAEEAATQTPAEFDRMHRNKWVSSSNTFIQPEQWDACKVAELPPLETVDKTQSYSGRNPVTNKSQWVFAIDAAVSGDCFGIVGVTKHYRPETKDYLFVPRYARKWTPEPGRKLDFAEPEAEIRRLNDSGIRIVNWVYDEYQMHELATRLRRDGIGWFKAFPQGKDRLIADKMLYDLITNRQIAHDGSLHDLREHLTNANAETTGDNKLRIVKRNEALKIDLAVCLSMGIFEAHRLMIT